MTEDSNCFSCKASVFSIWDYREKKGLRLKQNKTKKLKGRFFCCAFAELFFFEHREKIFLYTFL